MLPTSDKVRTVGCSLEKLIPDAAKIEEELKKQRDELRDHLERYADSYERSKWKADA